MRSSVRRIIKSVWIAALASVCLPTARGVIIDFEGIPDGTPVSAGSPYAGVAVIQATSTAALQLFNDQTARWRSALDYAEGTIVSGAALVLHPELVLRPIDSLESYRSEMVVSFLQPVVNVSFNAMAGFGSYSFQGRDEQGATLTGSGIWPSGGYPTWYHIDVSIPAGSFLTQLRLNNLDYFSNRAALIQMDNLSFDVQGVPDAGHGAIFLGLSGAGILLLHRWSRAAGARSGSSGAWLPKPPVPGS